MLSLLAKILDCDDFCVLSAKNKREKSLCEGNESHAYVSRAYQQRFNFFAVTSVTQGGKRRRKRWRKAVRGKGKKCFFRCCDTLILGGWIAYLLKYIRNIAVICCKIRRYRVTCDTCDSKNDKTPVYTRAREGHSTAISHLFSEEECTCWPYPGWSYWVGEYLLLFNRRVVFHQTTCCFSSNNVLFFVKRRVVFRQTTG